MMSAAVATATARSRNGNGKAAFEVLSISKIAIRCHLDRGTTKKRLDLHGYEPIDEKAKLKEYRFDADMLAKLTYRNDELAAANIRKAKAAAEKLELQNAEATGELASVADFTDKIQRVFGAMYKEVVVRMPTRLAARLAKAKTSADTAKILTNDLNRIFNTLRDDHHKFLGNGKK